MDSWVQKLQQELKRQRANLKPTDVGFVRPSTGYGSVSGSAAKFYGQGIINLRRGAGGGSVTTQFMLRAGSLTGTYSLSPGCVNNIAVVAGDLTISANSNVYIILTVSSGSGVVQSGTVATNSSPPSAQSPSTNFPPSSLELPLYKFTNGRADRIFGAWGIEIFSKCVGLEPGSGTQPFIPKYVWGILG